MFRIKLAHYSGKCPKIVFDFYPVQPLINILGKYVPYSHSIVAGGFELMSYTTRLMPRTWLIMSLDIFANKS